MKKLMVTFVAALPLATQAQDVSVTQSTVIDNTPNTMVVDSSDVRLPSSCEYRGPVSRNSPRIGTNKKAMKNLLKAAEKVNANVIVVTLLNLNSGIPMSGLGYRCSDVTEVAASLKVFVLPEED